MGAPKSGTTWLQTIMNAHPQIACFGEGHFIEQIVLPMQALLRHYNQKLEVVAEAVYGGQPYYPPIDGDDAISLIRPLIGGLMRRAVPELRQKRRQRWAERGGTAGARASALAELGLLWWGDKTPAYSRHIGELDRLFPMSRFIDIVRDPRDVAVSVLYHGVRAGSLTDVRGDTAKRHELIRHAMARWVEHNHSIRRARERLQGRLLQVRYEDLVADPAPQFRRLYAHLEGVTITDEIIANSVAACSFQAMSGGRQPGETDDTSFFRAGTSGQHEAELSDAERALVTELAGDLAPELAKTA